MKLIKAGPTQDQVLKDFFNKQVMSGHIDYRLERPNSFFSQYQALTPDYSTYVLQNDQQEIGAMASVLFRKGYVNHQEQMVGYVTDLRVQASRGATLNWEQAFMPVLEKEMEERNCRYLFSTLEQYESQAYNTLLRRRKRPGGLPRYHLFRRFFQVAILGKRFFADEPLSTIEISRANLSDIEAIAEYLREKSVGKPLYFDLPPEEIERRCHQWPEFS
ncbi:MAG: hypothetical protein KDD33_13650, partial [Bdellovibrionales bacterium]|nr:hypothetical protein [Bdellovibrionales bacterium]